MSREHSTAFVSIPESGRLPPERTADLLVWALDAALDGSLFISTDRGERVAFRFRGGLVSRWHSVEGHELVLEALADLLPPEQIAFVQKHAEQHGTDELGAIRRLCLLADTALYRLHRDCLSRELRSLIQKSHSLDYRFSASRDCFEGSEGLDQPIEPLGIIAEALLYAPSLEFCRERILETRHLPLFLRGPASGANTDLRGGARQIVQSLKRLPESYETLRLRNLVPEETLIATVYALWATNSVEDSGHRQSAAAVARSPVPQAPSGTSGSRPAVTLPPELGVSSTQPRDAEVRSSPLTKRPLESTSQSGRYRITSDSLSPHARSTPPPPQATELFNGPASGGPVSGGRPPEHPRAAERSQHPHVKSAHELSAESKTLDAWLRSVDQPSIAPRALKLAEKAADYFPTNTSILFYLGCLLTMNDQTLEGEAVIVHVLELDPDHLEAQNELERVKKINRAQSRTRPLTRLGRWGIRRSV